MENCKKPTLSAEYKKWLAELKHRYRSTQIKAAVSVNSVLIEFYWNLGKDISEKYSKSAFYGTSFFRRLSADLQMEMPGEAGFSPRNIRYCVDFYELYKGLLQQDVAKVPEQSAKPVFPTKAGQPEHLQQPVAKAVSQGKPLPFFLIPWGHHCTILDKCRSDVNKAMFYVCKTLENNWSRNVLLNWISSDLYGRSGKALTNYPLTLPEPDGDLAQQLTKDPYIFAVQGLSEHYNETELKKAMVANIETLLLELGSGFAFVGREKTVEVCGEEKRIDLLFYFIPQHRYLAVEVKTGEFDPADLGQLQGYVAACDLVLNRPGDNPAMGLLVCKGKNAPLVRYLLGKTELPLGVSDYELTSVLPDKFKSDIPSVEELEAELERMNIKESAELQRPPDSK